jgi:hypothetical protein
MKRKTLLWWIPAALVAVVAVAEGGMRVAANAAKRSNGKTPVTATAPTPSCRAHELMMDLDGDGRLETVRLTKVGDDAWADVWSGASMRSSTRLGPWQDNAELEAIDVNADGRTDMVRRWSEGKDQHATVWLSNGSAFDEGWSGITANRCLAQLAAKH